MVNKLRFAEVSSQIEDTCTPGQYPPAQSVDGKGNIKEKIQAAAKPESLKCIFLKTPATRNLGPANFWEGRT
jgi:hypothetical protein